MRILFKITIRTIRENPIYARVSPPVTIDTPSKIIIKMTPMLPIASSFTLMTTPLLQNWLSTWTRASLDQRIAKLEAQLANLEQIPEVDAVQNQILWEIKSVKLEAMSNRGVVLIMILLGVSVVTGGETPAVIGFSRLVLIIVILNRILMLLKRYHHDFRYLRSPDVRKSLRTAITELKKG